MCTLHGNSELVESVAIAVMMTIPTTCHFDNNNEKTVLTFIFCLYTGGRDNISVWGNFRRITSSETFSIQGGNPIAVYFQNCFLLYCTVLYSIIVLCTCVLQRNVLYYMIII